jgi:dTDP-4-amino-4,6-dideoxygalactose transaminase
VGAGDRVTAFERAIADYLGVKHVVCTSSCTAALTLCYEDAHVAAGDIVLSTAMTCAAANIPLLHLGARIVWLDVDPITGSVTPDALAAGLRLHPDARIAVVMDWAGLPSEYEGLRAAAFDAGIPLVLDAAQSFGSTLDGARCGSGATYVCYSFGPTKIFSAVEGGAIVTDDAEVARKFRALRWYGVDRAARDTVAFWEYDITTPGHRFTTNDVFATIGLQMLPRLEARLAHHRRIAAIYESRLRLVSGLVLPPPDARRESNYWMFSITAERRDDLMRRLHSEGVHAATPHNRNDHLGCFRAAAAPARLPGLDAFGSRYLCLPIGAWVSEDDAERICAIVAAGW